MDPALLILPSAGGGFGLLGHPCDGLGVDVKGDMAEVPTQVLQGARATNLTSAGWATGQRVRASAVTCRGIMNDARPLGVNRALDDRRRLQ